MKPTTKYIGLNDDRTKLIVIPSKDGIEKLRGLLTEGLVKIAKQEILAFTHTFSEPAKFVKVEYILSTNIIGISAWLNSEKRESFGLPMTVADDNKSTTES